MCPHGGFLILRHNDIQNITASLLSEMHPNVIIEPPLQPLSGEQLHFASSILDDEARLDIAEEGFWSFTIGHFMCEFSTHLLGLTLVSFPRPSTVVTTIKKLRAYE